MSLILERYCSPFLWHHQGLIRIFPFFVKWKVAFLASYEEIWEIFNPVWCHLYWKRYCSPFVTPSRADLNIPHFREVKGGFTVQQEHTAAVCFCITWDLYTCSSISTQDKLLRGMFHHDCKQFNESRRPRHTHSWLEFIEQQSRKN